jgi:hypothetical protein
VNPTRHSRKTVTLGIVALATMLHADFADDALALTGGRQVKIAYLSNGKLRGYDTDTRQFTDILTSGVADVHQGPYISPDGSMVAYYNRDGKTHVVNWNGSGDKAIASGRPTRFWKKPSDGSFQVYIFTRNGDHSPVRRYSVANPSVSELVWDKSTLNGGFGVSADGTHAGSMEWPIIEPSNATSAARYGALRGRPRIACAAGRLSVRVPGVESASIALYRPNGSLVWRVEDSFTLRRDIRANGTYIVCVQWGTESIRLPIVIAR